MADPAAPPRPRRLWRVVFAISLALNLAVVGVVAGFALRQGGDGPPRGFDMSFGVIGAALTPDDRRAILRDLRQNTDLRGARRGADITAVADVLNTTPFSPTALKEVMATGKTQRDLVITAAMDAFVARMSEMTDAERATVAERLLETRGKRPGGPRKRDN